ncbi:MAG: hypothetical protein C0505_16555 [Leptothrix sp. (in: Bacteria)]|nr:hypothetical protein [Leptothrix sp. (in: b-proteobacteria)]
MLMTATNASAAPAFELKPATAYFKESSALALLAAAQRGDAAQARQLVAAGADPNAEGPPDNPYNRLRLLHYAIAAQDAKALRVLVEVGADPELSVVGFGRALMFAVTLDRLDMMATLLELRPVAKLGKETLESLMFGAVSLPRPQALDLLLQRGAPIDLPDAAGYTIFMRAMGAQDYDLAAKLLQRGASLKVESTSGATPASSVQFHLQKFKPGSPSHEKVARLKAMMEARGVVFPVPTPQQVRDARRVK